MRIAFGLLTFAIAATVSAQAAATKQIASYDITATLDSRAKAIAGSETLTWVNDSPDEIRELRFHLYMNAFKNEKSTFMRESGGQLRSERARKDAWGWIDVKRMRIEGGADLTGAIRFVQPDDGNTDDRTVIAVALPAPVKPGASIRVAIDFYTKLPHVFARAGYHADFFMAAQWFPKLGVWEEAGERYSTQGAWNCHQYHAHSEFYSDFGRYVVNLTVPSNYVVGATGVMEKRTESSFAKTATYRFVQEDVHDFAWTASPVFKRIERTFTAAAEVSPRELAETAKLLGLPEDEVKLQDVRMTLLIQPEHEGQAERHFKALRAGLKYFGLWYGKYPYPTITVVDPPYGGGGAGGMEYPTLITAGTSWIPADEGTDPEMVVVHEFGHQYWYGMAASNEFEESWLDEGFNTYSTSRVLDLAYPPFQISLRAFSLPVSRWLGVPSRNWDAVNRAAYLPFAKADNMVRNAWDYQDSGSYVMNSYMRPGVTLRMLENLLGKQTMARVMRTYFQRWKYRHPDTQDFLAVLNDVSGRDWKWFFDQFVYNSNALDYKVGEVRSREIGRETGVFDGPKGRFTLNEPPKRDEKAKKQYENVVMIEREGEAVAPVEIRVRFENGEVVNRQWDGQYRWTKLTFVRPAEVASVEIDPERKLLLDTGFANNSWIRSPQRLPLAKWTANLLFWAQNALLWLSAIA